jgi:nanoRNase/pAp phosphatase (c-di-AMP/oligoRNAs hydrolase)
MIFLNQVFLTINGKGIMPMRLLTRSDFDGLACGVLLKEAGIIDEWKFVHPKDMQDGIIEVSENDVLANVPFVPGCGLWFDHHSSEEERLELKGRYEGESRLAPSAARVIYDYYGGKDAFPNLGDMMTAVDKTDSGQLTVEEIINPQKWILLSFIMDPRTGLGRFQDYRISNYQLMENLIDYCRQMPIEDIMELPDIKERISRYYEQDSLFREMLKKYSYTKDNVLITDLRGVETIYTGNRFLVYSLYPEQNISVWIIDGRNKENCVISAGHSIINRTSQTDVGSLLLKYGGGGHRKVGTCQVPYEEADKTIEAIVTRLRENG